MPGGEQGQADGHTGMLDHIRRKLRAAAYTHGGVDVEALFRHYDRDNSGDIGFDEFRSAVRRDAKVPQAHLSDAQLRTLFRSVDTDDSGDVTLNELTVFLADTPRKSGGSWAAARGVSLETAGRTGSEPSPRAVGLGAAPGSPMSSSPRASPALRQLPSAFSARAALVAQAFDGSPFCCSQAQCRRRGAVLQPLSSAYEEAFRLPGSPALRARRAAVCSPARDRWRQRL